MQLQNDEGGVVIYEAEASGDVEARAREVVGWTPEAIVFVRKAWDLAQVVAEELAVAIEGAVFCDVDDQVFFDAAGDARPAASLPELEARLKNAFENPEPFFERWEKEAKARQEGDPAVAADNDWSDLA